MIKANYSGGFLLATTVIMLAICWRGLSGPLVFDDLTNLSPLADEISPNYHEIIFSNHSGPFGRSVSMATFAANHWISVGLDSFALKLTNLVIHMANGVLLYYISLILLQRPFADPRAHWLAVTVSACWLLSPMNTGVVFYAIQRMALLACFFVFAGILCYVLWRRGQIVARANPLFLVICLLCWPLACFSKENGVLLPALILIIECYFFSRARLFSALRLTLLVSLISGCAAIYVLHTFGLLDYADRGFTLMERLSTQPLAVAQYTRELLLPIRVDVGIFNDDFHIQHTPWNWRTLGCSALIGFLIVKGLLCTADSSHRPIWGGVLFYLAGHSVESTAIPLEMYFEHRNYLPSAGLYIAAVLMVNAVATRATRGRTATALLPLLVLVWFGFISYQKAQAWTSWSTLVTNAYEHHPTSARAGLEMASLLLRSNQGAKALQVNSANASYNPEKILPLTLQRFYIYCRTGAAIDDSEYGALSTPINPVAFLETSTAFELLLEVHDRKGCTNVNFDRVMQNISNMVDVGLSDGSITTSQAWHVDYYVIEYARAAGHDNIAKRRLQRSIEGGNAKASYYLDAVINAFRED